MNFGFALIAIIPFKDETHIIIDIANFGLQTEGKHYFKRKTTTDNFRLAL